jgi:D-glycero-D-manno-heptose 1,7-bisphosphate phosphatase
MDERIACNSECQSKKTWLIQDYFSKPKDPRAIIFLDRDDTLIKDLGDRTHKKLPKMNLNFITELSILANKLNHKIIFVIVTNQSKIFKGDTSILALKFFHFMLVIYCRIHGVRIQRIVTCPHTAGVNCECRKPKPTTILDTLNNFNCESIPRFMVGNNITDIQAGLNAGCFTLGISEKIFAPTKTETNKLFLGYFTLKSSFAQDILKKMEHN